MKTTLIGILFFPLLFISCTSQENTEDLIVSKKNNLYKKSTVSTVPENAANPYDSVGRLHNEVLEIYLASNSGSTTSENIMAQIQSITLSSPINITEDCNTISAFNSIDNIVANPQESKMDIIANSSLSLQGKADLSRFIDSLEVVKQRSYPEIYQFITSYESEILSGTNLNNNDKRIILTTSSVVRYSTYYDKRKDRDWDGSVGNFIGAIVGVLDSSLSPVTMALVTGISYNNSTVN